MYQEPEREQNRLPTPPNGAQAATESHSQAPDAADGSQAERELPNHAGELKSDYNGEVSPKSPQQNTELSDHKPATEGVNGTSPHGDSEKAVEENDVKQHDGSMSDGNREQPREQPREETQEHTNEHTQGQPSPSQAKENPVQGSSINGNQTSLDQQLLPQLKQEHSSQLLSQFVDVKTANNAAVAAAAVAALREHNEHNGLDTSRVSLALLLEASAAAAEAEKKAENQQLDPEILRKCAEDRAETDKYITDAIHRVQTTPRDERSIDLRPVDRRDTQVPTGWSRFEEIHKDAQLLGECRRLVRGTQGCGRECDAKFTNLIDFAKHVDEMHDVNFRPFLCPQERCPWGIIGFHERSECTRHIRTKHYRAMYACEYQGCTKVYNRSDAFRRHVRQAHANPGSRFNRLTQRADDNKN